MTSATVDAYIAQAPPFAQPILRRVRAAFQRACPEVTESIKWSRPSFSYRGKMLAVIGAWKSHVRLHFWQADALPDPRDLFGGQNASEAGALKLRTAEDLPPDDVLDVYIGRAVRLLETGEKPARRADRTPKPPLAPPADFLGALRVQPAADEAFAALRPSHRREYVEWILEAKRDATRQQRIRIAVEWLGEGKTLNWKYAPKAGV
jgi:uncharacterized protein YdeI (YjbR/CyaY-like superfamily)